MAKVEKVVMHSQGAIRVMNSSGVQDYLLSLSEEEKRRAESLSKIPGCEYIADVRAGKTRAHSMVKLGNPKAVAEQKARNTLLKARVV